jgi:cytochrome oxidase Cu insertion factor (SCO1/SenC/PrrC family)
VVAYIVQIRAHRLTAPWYLPIAATIGLGLVAVSLWRARSVWRVLALVLVVLVAGAAWTFLLGTRLPPYTGPVAVGRPFPAFETVRADGTPFTQRDLQGKQNSVMVFFRGRW